MFQIRLSYCNYNYYIRLNKLNFLNSKRCYQSIKGIFGNYVPRQLDLERFSRHQLNNNNDVEPCPYHVVKECFQYRGHLLCQLDPLKIADFFKHHNTNEQSLLNILEQDQKKFSSLISPVIGVDLDRFLNTQAINKEDGMEFIRRQLKTYCGYIGYEFMHLYCLDEVDWFQKQIEHYYDEQQSRSLNPDNNIRLEQWAKDLLITEAVDHFLAKKFPSVKRYGCEGAESMIIFIQELINQLKHEPESTYNELIIGMPHRGRLNLLVNTLQYPLEALFNKLQGRSEYELTKSTKRQVIGDVLSHLYTMVEFKREEQSEHPVTVTMLPNPSHLEAIAPVVCGLARGRMMHQRRAPYYHQSDHALHQSKYSILPLQVHGDASFTGQGVIMEILAMSNVEHYSCGGSIHLVVNNQVGYTTPGRMHQARSSWYCTDPLKMIHAPVIHVNGDHPDAVAQAARLAFQYHQTFHKDIAINLVCFRKWGHNELDDPTFTNPRMYEAVRKRKSTPVDFADRIQMPETKMKDILGQYNQKMNEALDGASTYKPPPLPKLIESKKSSWRNIGWPQKDRVTKWNTAVPMQILKHVGKVMITSPEGFNIHPTISRVFKDRDKRINTSRPLDWATTELLAFGTLLYQGNDVRISGQDVGRGTFSQRHAMIVDQKTNDVYIPLNDLVHHHHDNQDYLPWKHESIGQLEVCNSILSEEAVMAFEYGLSLSSPQVLAIWEAQFGDFFNGAQIIIDTFLSSGEGKWLLQSSLTLLLPNGYDGAGPEHTSARLERFLQLSNSSEVEIDSDDVNWSVVYPTTPAQYFHLLRRQMNRPYRKPMVVMSPKMLLRHPRCVSTLDDLSLNGSHFRPVLDDPIYQQTTYHPQLMEIDTNNYVNNVRSLIFCSGKHYYTLQKEREDRFGGGDTEKPNEELIKKSNIAIIRLEELCPFPAYELANIFKRYPNAKNLIWSQEEHRNMGAWSFIEPRFRNILNKTNLKYVGRNHLEAPAIGISDIHKQEMEQLMKDTFDACKQ